MAPTGKKAEAWLEKAGIIGSRHSRRPRRKRSEPRRRPATYQSTDTQKLLQRLLNAGKHNQGTENKKMNLSQAQWLQKLLRKYQERFESSHDKTEQTDNSASAGESECSVAGSASETMEVTNSSRSTSSRSSSVSSTSQRDNVVQPMTLAQSIENMRSLLRKEPVVQIINSCFKAGIEEGKRRAKKYVQHVLSFGLNTGYLIPGDPRAEAGRVSPRVLESKRADAESRLRRRRARRGEDVPANVKRKDLRRGTGASTATKNKAPGADSTEVAPAGKKRGRKSKSSSPRTSPTPQGTSKQEKTGRKDERATKRKPVEKKKSQHKRAKNRNKSPSSSRQPRSKRHRNRTPESRTGVKLPENEANQRIARERVRSASRSKSVPTPRTRQTPRDNVELAHEHRSIGGACYEYDDCRITGNDA